MEMEIQGEGERERTREGEGAENKSHLTTQFICLSAATFATLCVLTSTKTILFLKTSQRVASSKADVTVNGATYSYPLPNFK